MTNKRLTIALAAAAALIPASAPAHAADVAENRPANYGSCVAYEAMFGEDPVNEFTELTTPLTAFLDDDGIRVVGPQDPRPGEDAIGCKPE